MLKITHDEKKIEVRFFHQESEPAWIEANTGICVDESRRCSMAIVSIQSSFGGSSNVSERTGISVCHPNDNFCRATGRKRALRDALFSLEKDIRGAIWGEYEVQMGF